MLNVITSLSLNALADDMLNKIKDCWHNPFVSPIIVFTDAKTEQWFKLHILKQQNVLMNLQTTRLESFLFKSLKTSENQYLLTPDLLRDAIVQKLLCPEVLDKIKGKDNIANYLNIAVDYDNIDYRHLFDFADDLSKLFIDYEATRDNIDDAVPGDDWQKDLYNAIIGDGIVFNDIHYLTCPEMAAQNRAENNGKIVFRIPENQHIFVFGFSGMGQKYRHLLQEFSQSTNLYVYLQTKPDAVDGANIFLKHWSQYGIKNHELFITGKNAVTNSISGAPYNDNTTLGKIQNAIFQNTNIPEIKATGSAVNDGSVTVTSAPSKIKEIEIVHSAVCQLLHDKQKNVTLKDILVLAPDIEQYKSAIATVFNQIDENDTEYPLIPISIVDYSGKNSAILDAMQALYTILHNGGLTRKTFFALAKNNLIQNRYKITDDDVSNVFQPWIENMRVFRTHTTNNADGGLDTIDDWDIAVNRMLIAKLTDNDKFMPFSDFNTEDDNLLTKFVQICDDVKNRWINRFNTTTLLTQQCITELQKFLNELFAMDESANTTYVTEQIVWERINRKLELYKEFNVPIPTEYVLLSLIDIASNVKFNNGTVFTRGVTFTSFLANRIFPAKYVFLIGMDSETFPGTNKDITLDRRTRTPQIGDEDIPAKNKNAFLCQLMATANELHISFVSKDLQTDNTFYPSCVVEVLTRYTGVETRNIGIDETRPWNELYTPREWRNKQTCIDLNRSIQNPVPLQSKSPAKQDLPDTVRIKDFQYFLENPLKCYANRTFGFEEDDASNQELEDIELSTLDKSNLQKRLIKPLIHGIGSSHADYKDLLPIAPFDRPAFEKARDDLQFYIDTLRAYNQDFFGDQEITIEPNFPINVHLNCDGKEYDLRGEILMFEKIGTDILLCVKDAADAPKQYPEMYALVAQIAEPNIEYTIHIVHPIKNKLRAHIITNMTKKYAEHKLNEFYKRAFIDGDKRHIAYFDSSIFGTTKTNKTKHLKVSFEKYKAKFMDTKYNHYYISNTELFNPDIDLGFTETNFETEYPVAIHEHAKLVKKPTDEE